MHQACTVTESYPRFIVGCCRRCRPSVRLGGLGRGARVRGVESEGAPPAGMVSSPSQPCRGPVHGEQNGPACVDDFPGVLSCQPVTLRAEHGGRAHDATFI